MNVKRAIAKAERLLPGKPAPEGKRDPRWQAILVVGDFIPTDPREVWAFARKWAASPSDDVRLAVATCLLEHLLEKHFDLVFPLAEQACAQSKRFAETLEVCWELGQTRFPPNRKRFRALLTRMKKTRPTSVRTLLSRSRAKK